MEINYGNIDDVYRISHLLASALRHEDADRFLNIYDTIIPSEITQKQVDEIKERARNLADLPQEEFDQLSAEFELVYLGTMSHAQQAFTSFRPQATNAETKPKSSPMKLVNKNKEVVTPPSDLSPPDMSNNSSSSVESSMEDGDSRDGAYWDYSPSSNSMHTTDKIVIHNKDKMPGKPDKITVHNSHKADTMDYREQMVYDYCPDQNDLKLKDKYDYKNKNDLKVTDNTNLKDEELCEVVVDSNPRRKPSKLEEKNDVTRKLNEQSYDEVYQVEELNFRRVSKIQKQNDETRQRNNQQFDEAYQADDDVPTVNTTNVHQELYGRGTGYSSMRTEESQNYISGSSRCPIYAGVGRSKLRSNADQTIGFFSSSMDIPRASQGTQISLDSYSRTSRLPVSPDYRRSYGSLEEGCSRPTNDPNLANNNIDVNKKKKKKKTGKDDSAEKAEKSTTTSKVAVDENGNPVNPVITKSTNNVLCSNFSHSLDTDELGEVPSKDMPSASDNTPQANKQKKKCKKKSDDGFEIAEKLFPNNCGSRTVDDLVEFIENSDNSAKSKKEKSKPNQNGMVSLPNDKHDKTHNKKTKKVRSSSLTENHKESEYGSERGDDCSSKVSEQSEMKDVNHEAYSEAGSVELNHKMPNASPPPSSINQDDDSLVDMYEPFDIQSTVYKFTDKEPLTLNDTGFTEVRKKKKPRAVVETSRNFSNRDHNYDYERVPREQHHRHVTPGRSVTPPPKSSSRQERHERAFSPSAFPELGGNGHGREGRRNSTGNVPCGTSLDDSDLESVKSLPTGTSNDLGPNCPVISYAKVAAKPKQNGGAGAATSPVAAAKVDNDDKVAGLEEHQPTTPEMPAAQSPELPSVPKLNCDPQPSRNISTTKSPKVSSHSDKDFNTKDMTFSSGESSPVICNNTSIFPKDNNKYNLEFVGDSHIQNNIELGIIQTSAANSRGSSVDKHTYCPNDTETDTSCNITGMQNTTVENNHKKSTACSVIFMDRPAQGGQHIDISFGYEEPCDAGCVPPCVDASACDMLQYIHKAKPNGLILPPPYQVPSGLVFLGPETDFNNQVETLPVSSCPSSSPPSSSSSSAELSTLEYPPLTGLSSVEYPLLTGPTSVEYPPLTSLSTMEYPPLTGPSSVEYPPLTAAIVSSTKPVTHHCDPNYDSGKFALEDTVYYIRREWDRLTDLAHRNPNKVIYYSCD